VKKFGLRILICIAIILSCLPQLVIAWDFNLFKKEEKVEKKEITYKIGDTIPEMVIDSLIAKYATGTKAIIMKKTLYCESGYKNVQSNVIKKGEREISYGIAQIHLGFHPQVSLEQALDPDYSIHFMADNLGKVKWYGYLIKEDRCNTI
jgi:hypothetical protein